MNTSYNGNITINPKDGLIDSTIEIIFYPTNDTNVITFDLNKNFKIQDIDSDFFLYYDFDIKNHLSPFLTDAGILSIYLSKIINKGDSVKINIKYSGKPGLVTKYEVNRVTKDWIELGLYTPWFPYDMSLRNVNFNVQLLLDNDYKIISNGKVKYINELRSITTSNAFNDLTILASKEFKKEHLLSNDLSVKLYYTEESQKDHVDFFKEITEWLINFYSTKFKKVENNELTIVFPKRKFGGGYARPGLLVMCVSSKLNSENMIGLFRYLAHEIAHLWWMNASSQTYDDWLNESFAEYSALLAIKEYYGIDVFKNYIDEKTKKVISSGPIIGLKRDSDEAYNVLYNKGPIILYKLENRIGSSDFLDLLSEIYSKRISNTEELLKLISNTYSNDVSDYLCNLLKI